VMTALINSRPAGLWRRLQSGYNVTLRISEEWLKRCDMKTTLSIVALAVAIVCAIGAMFGDRILDASVDVGEAGEFLWHRFTTGVWAHIRHLSVTNSVVVLGPFNLPYTITSTESRRPTKS
jgi:hypothetical protein